MDKGRWREDEVEGGLLKLFHFHNSTIPQLLTAHDSLLTTHGIFRIDYLIYLHTMLDIRYYQGYNSRKLKAESGMSSWGTRHREPGKVRAGPYEPDKHGPGAVVVKEE